MHTKAPRASATAAAKRRLRKYAAAPRNAAAAAIHHSGGLHAYAPSRMPAANVSAAQKTGWRVAGSDRGMRSGDDMHTGASGKGPFGPKR